MLKSVRMFVCWGLLLRVRADTVGPMEKNRNALWAMSVVACAIVGLVALYFGGFILQKDANNRSTDASRSSVQYVSSTETAIRQQADGIAQIDVDLAKAGSNAGLVAALTGQRKAYINDLCANVAKIEASGLSADIGRYNAQYCAR